MACIYMSQTSVMYHEARHIYTCVYHLRDLRVCKDCFMVLEKVASAEQVADSLTKSMPKPAFEKHRASMLGLPTAPDCACSSAPAPAPLKPRVVATGTNAEDIGLADDDDDELGLLTYVDELRARSHTRPSSYDASTMVLAASLLCVLYACVTVIAMLAPVFQDGFALLLIAVATGARATARFWDPPVDIHLGTMVLLVRATGA
eukprot:1273359-Rhodomonas_salina.1